MLRCYRKRKRERALSRGPVDRHSTAIYKEWQKLFQASAQMMISLGRLGVNKEDLNSIVEIARPYLTPIPEQLRLAGMPTNELPSDAFRVC